MNGQDQRKEDLRETPMAEYLEAHSGGNGWKAFFRSNLFTALVIFILTQSIIVGGSFIAIYFKVSAITEWKGGVDRTLETFKTQGSPALRLEVEHHMKDNAEKFGQLEARMKAAEDDTKHLDVMEAEFRRITTDVEAIKVKK